MISSSDPIVMVAWLLPRLLCLGLIIILMRHIWRSLRAGYLLAYNERVERRTRPGWFWFFIGLWVVLICLFSYGAVMGIS